MPTYEYACRRCGEHVEVVQSFRDDPLTICGLCGGPLRKVFGAAGIIFKGSGYYVTDSRKKAAKGKDAGSSDGGAAQQPDGQRSAKEGQERPASEKHGSKRREPARQASGSRSAGGSSSTGTAGAAESA
jgi:putative FmdB family regulatory protein